MFNFQFFTKYYDQILIYYYIQKNVGIGLQYMGSSKNFPSNLKSLDYIFICLTLFFKFNNFIFIRLYFNIIYVLNMKYIIYYILYCTCTRHVMMTTNAYFYIILYYVYRCRRVKILEWMMILSDCCNIIHTYIFIIQLRLLYAPKSQRNMLWVHPSFITHR